MFYDLLATAIESAGRSQLDDYSRQVWRAHGAGLVADDQAQQLQELIQRRRGPPARRLSPPRRHSAALLHPAVPRAAIAGPAGFASAPARTCGDRAIAAGIAAGFTTGELAVLKVISDEWLAHGACDRSLNELAAQGRGLPFAGQAGGQARRTGWPVHGTAPAAVGPQAPHQHHPHRPRRMARLAAQGPPQGLRDRRLQQGQADLCRS